MTTPIPIVDLEEVARETCAALNIEPPTTAADWGRLFDQMLPVFVRDPGLDAWRNPEGGTR